MTDTLTTATDLHARAQRGFSYLRTHYDAPTLYQKGRTRLKHLYLNQYIPAVDDLLASTSTADLTAMQATLEQRLSTGWERMGDHGTDAQYDTFTRLLTQYEVISEALRNTPIETLLERLECVDSGLVVPDNLPTSV